SVIPAGADSRLKVSVLAGRSASVAVLVRTNVVSSLTVRLVGTLSTGGVFTSLTTTVKLSLTLNGGEPLSVTCTVIRLVLGPWISVGVHLKTPVFESRVIPAGADTRVKLSELSGMSGSIGVFVTIKVLSSLIG